MLEVLIVKTGCLISRIITKLALHYIYISGFKIIPTKMDILKL